MWDTYNEDSRTSKFKIWKIIRISAFVIIGIIIFAVASNQSVNLFMNVVEFGTVFTKPLFYWIVSGLVLSSIALVRINFRRSNSMTWFAIRLIANFLKRGDLEFSSSPGSTTTSSFRSRSPSSPSSSSSSSPSSSFFSSDSSKFPLRYQDFRLGKRSFIIWQITKILLFAPLFTNLIFGITVVYILGGHDIGLGSLPNIFLFPFVSLPSNGTFAQQQVVPLIPALTLLIPSLLSAIGIRIFLYIGVQGGISIATRYMADTSENRPRMLSYISIIERILGAALIWTGITMFFGFNINYNTKYAILGTLIMGAFFVFYSIMDGRRSRIIVTPERRQIYTRLFTIVVITIVTGSLMVLNNSIADAKKIEWKGPYTAQEISVNRYLAGLDQVRVVNYNLPPPPIPSLKPSSSSSLPPSSTSHSSLQPHSSSSSSPPKVSSASAILSARNSISGIVAQNNDTLSNIRLWDEQAAQSKLRSWLGLGNDVNLAATNIVRFNKTMYWAAATSPNLPADVTPENTWYNEHFVYTHSAKGVLMMQASTGNVTDSSSYFKQKNIYYGDSGPTGIFNQAWSAYPNGRTTSDEIGGAFYNGPGGVNLTPPVSWIFEPNFMLSYTDSSMHIMRFKDIYDRMSAMYPYFVYNFALGSSENQLNIRNVGVVPVTDGRTTYWLMPLIVLLDTSHVPWSSGDMLKLVGFALIDAYSGSVQIIRDDGGDSNNDAFSQIFFQQYSLDQNNKNNGGVTILSQVPEWLKTQLVYPEEMFSWKINRFNQYHITDPKTFIEAQQFYKVPDDASSFYTIAKPLGFDKPQYVGFQSIGASNSPSQNLVGYMVVQNDAGNFGKMIFYSIPPDSTTNLIGASAARDLLEKDPSYANEKSLFRNPRVGDELLYRVGNQEVYFIPVYTSSDAAGAVAQIGAIAAVGASSATGKYYVGLGDIPRHAFENYLLKAAGIIPVNQSSALGVANRTTAAPTTTAATKPNATTPTTASTTIINKQVQEKRLQAARILQLEKIFTDAGLIVLKPTIISAPVSFKEANATFVANSQLDLARNSISKFLKEFSIAGLAISPSNNVTNATSSTNAPRIFEWQSDNNNTVNFGLLKIVNGIVENHYISIRVG